MESATGNAETSKRLEWITSFSSLAPLLSPLRELSGRNVIRCLRNSRISRQWQDTQMTSRIGKNIMKMNFVIIFAIVHQAARLMSMYLHIRVLIGLPGENSWKDQSEDKAWVHLYDFKTEKNKLKKKQISQCVNNRTLKPKREWHFSSLSDIFVKTFRDCRMVLHSYPVPRVVNTIELCVSSNIYLFDDKINRAIVFILIIFRMIVFRFSFELLFESLYWVFYSKVGKHLRHTTQSIWNQH